MDSEKRSALSNLTSRRVWYKLISSANCDPHLGTGIDGFSIHSDALLLDVRDAVYARNSHRLKLTDVTDLQIFDSESSFHKWNKEGPIIEPLSPGSPIGSFGISHKNPIILVVSVGRLSSLDSCEIPFFMNILRAEESEGSVVFEDIIPSTSLKKLFVRECYLSIASSLMVGNTKAIITGTPGIGKSLFLVYLLWKTVKEHKRVLFIYHPYNIYYDGRGGVFRLPPGYLPPDTDVSFWKIGRASWMERV